MIHSAYPAMAAYLESVWARETAGMWPQPKAPNFARLVKNRPSARETPPLRAQLLIGVPRRGWQHEPSLGEAVPRPQGHRLDHEIRGRVRLAGYRGRASRFDEALLKCIRMLVLLHFHLGRACSQRTYSARMHPATSA